MRPVCLPPPAWLTACVFHPVQPKAVSETEEQDLAQLMAKAGAENAEVSGDEDDDEV